jgi:hypothetical protein
MQNLLDIANAYVTTYLYADNSGLEFQLTDTIYDVRSFTNNADYYYVNQELIVTQGTNQFGYVYTQNRVLDTTLISPPSIIQPSPNSNPSAMTYTSGVSETVGGSFGVNAAQGLNASVNASISISNSTTVTVPPIEIFNEVDPKAGVAAWEYAFSKPPATGVTTTLNDQWIWQVPFTSYPSPPPPNANTFTFQSGYLYAPPSDPTMQNGGGWNYSAPRPFGNTFALQYPYVSSVCDGRSENVARAGGRRSARKRSAHGLIHGLRDTMEVSLTPSRPFSREVYGCTQTWRPGPRSAVASSSTA